MEKIEFDLLELNLYKDKLDNGLEMYIVPNKKVNNIYATFSTRYGAIQSEFVPLGEEKMIKVPDGVAHFLEHKMFEQEKGKDPFTFFSERGADANANTSSMKTTYLFSGPDFFSENLNYLLDYVQKPYFTDENVEKEKGIIEQEIKMYKDDPYSVLYEKTMFNTFKTHPIRKSVIGTEESVNSITKEILYKCYNTFYNPGNMFIVITGNVDPQQTLQIITENQKNKEFEKMANIKIKKYKEEDEVYKEYEEIKMNINIPKVTVNFKFNLKDLEDLSVIEKINYISMILENHFGSTSLFNEKLIKQKMINFDLELSSVRNDTHMVFTIFFESIYYKEIIKLIEEEIKNINITEEELERLKKVRISSNVLSSDNIFSVNHGIMNNLIMQKKVITNINEITKKFNIKDAHRVLKKLNFKNKSIVVIEKK